MNKPSNFPHSTTITISEWNETYRPVVGPLDDDLWLELPEGIEPGQIWTQFWTGDKRHIVSGIEELPLEDRGELNGYRITEVAVSSGDSISVEPEPWTEADRSFIMGAAWQWEQDRGIGISGRVAADDFDDWFFDNHPSSYDLLAFDCTESLLNLYLPELDAWSLYIDYLGSEGEAGRPVPGIERGCGLRGLDLRDGEVRLTRWEWMWRFLPKVCVRPDDAYERLEWLVDRPEEESFVRRQDPRCVWTQDHDGREFYITNGCFPGSRSDYYYITEVPCPEGVLIEVRDSAPGYDDDEECHRHSSSIRICRPRNGVARVQRPELRIDLHRGDCLEVLRRLPDACLDVVITSPPYLSIVDYGGGTWEGGRKGCDHRLPRNRQGHFQTITGDTCPLCGAKRLTHPLGMEPTLEAYLKNLCAIFDEVKRVLKDTGSLWVNIGDLYTPQAGAHGIGGIGAGSLAMVPARFAIEMTDRHGWVLRNEVIWHKPSIRPMGFRNRLHVDFEPFYFFTKKSSGYYFDQPEEPGASTDWRAGRTVWVEHLGANPCGREGAFPLGVVERIVLACCPPDGTAADIFMGSGTTGIVAAHYGFNFLGIELDRAMFRAARDRFEDEGFGSTTHIEPLQRNLVMSRSSALAKNSTTTPAGNAPAPTPAKAARAPINAASPAKRPGDPRGDLESFVLSRMDGHPNYKVARAADGELEVVRVKDSVRLTVKQLREVRHGMLRRDRQRAQRSPVLAEVA